MDHSALFQLDLASWQVAMIIMALVLAGIIKGATGAGAPIIAVPVMAAIVDVRFAIVMMLLPNLLTNIWQAHRFWDQRPRDSFLWAYVGAGAAGIVTGTVLLTTLSLDVLSFVIGLSVVAYLALRLARPDWILTMSTAERFAVPAGFTAGMLQGATGLAAPALLSFLNAMRLPRLTFVSTVSLLFITFSVAHLLALTLGGLVGPQVLIFSLVALVPISFGMIVGTRLLHVMSAEAFERLVLALLALIAARIFYGALMGWQ